MLGIFQKTNVEKDGSSDLVSSNLENFTKHLQEVYNYDSVDVHLLKKDGAIYNSSIFENSLDFISICNNGKIEKDYIYYLRKNITDYFNDLTLIKLTRYYQYHDVTHYLIVTNFFDKENNHKIIIHTKFNSICMLNLKPLVTNGHQFTYPDLSNFYEFKNDHFETVLEINITVNDSPPLLKDPLYKAVAFGFPVDDVDYNRKAQLIIRKHSEVSSNHYILDSSLFINNRTIKIKSEKINEPKFSIVDHVDKFLFPLCESNEDLTAWELNPVLTHDFMNQDHTPFWDLKMMVAI